MTAEPITLVRTGRSPLLAVCDLLGRADSTVVAQADFGVLELWACLGPHPYVTSGMYVDLVADLPVATHWANRHRSASSAADQLMATDRHLGLYVLERAAHADELFAYELLTHLR